MFMGPQRKFKDYAMTISFLEVVGLILHILVLDLLPKRDLYEKLAKNHLLRYIEGDKTQDSESLLGAIKEGRDIDMIPEWGEERQNVSASNTHFQRRLSSAAHELETRSNNVAVTLEWLHDAEGGASYLTDRFEDEEYPIEPDLVHLSIWREAYEYIINIYDLI